MLFRLQDPTPFSFPILLPILSTIPSIPILPLSLLLLLLLQYD